MSATAPAGAAAATKLPPQRLVAVLVTVGSLLAVSLLVLTTSRSAFTDVTENRENSWATGTVELDDDHQEVGAMFEATNMVPEDVVSKEIIVENLSTAESVDVHLYAENLTGDEDLADWLNLTITVDEVEVFNDTLAKFAEDHTDADTGTAPWLAVEPEETRTYEFSVELDSETPNTEQDKEAGIDFVWEASSNSTM